MGEPFSPPIPLHDVKTRDTRLAAVRALKPGYISTLYETTPAEATTLLRACGISPASLKQLCSISSGHPPSGGAGFGSAAENRKVEQAAVKKFRAHYRAHGWQLTDLQTASVGYDFEARRPRSPERHIELKGARGPSPSFIITENEVRSARHDPRWRLAVVTSALSSKPLLWEWSAAKFLKDFAMKPLSYTARLK